MKARFEEVSMKEKMKSGCRKTPTESTDQHSSSKTSLKTFQSISERQCFHFGGTGHIARDCPLKGRGALAESRVQCETTNPAVRTRVY